MVTIVLSTLALLSTVAVIIYYFFMRKYTRERFAFVVFSQLFILTSLLLSSLIGGLSIPEIIITALNGLFSWNIPSPKASFLEHALGFLLVAFLGTLGILLHRNWRGGESIRERENDRRNIDPHLIADVIAVLAKPTRPSALTPHDPTLQYRLDDQLDLGPDLPIAWRLHALEIANLILRPSRFDADDWVPALSGYIGRGLTSDRDSFLLCLDTISSDRELHDAVSKIREDVPSIRTVNVLCRRTPEIALQRPFPGVSQLYIYEDAILKLCDFTDYFTQLTKRYSSSPLRKSYPYTLEDVYVEPEMKLHRQGSQARVLHDPLEYVLEWLKTRDLRHLAILGEYGTGKSSFSLHVCHRLISEAQAGSRVPILIPLGGKSPRVESELELLASFCIPYGFDPRAIHLLHRLGRVLLIFDAFDEIDLVNEPELLRDNFRRIWGFARVPSSKVMITGRPNFFLNDAQREASLNTRRAGDNLIYTESLEIERFDPDRIVRALRAFPQATRTDMQTLLQKAHAGRSSFVDLISRPSTLFLAASIWNEIRVDALSGLLSVDVMDRFLTDTLERQEAKDGGGFLSSLERRYFMMGIAVRMASRHGFSNSLPAAELVEYVEALLANYPKLLDDVDKVDGAAPRPTLRERIGDRRKLNEATLRDVISCGVLVRDPSTFDQFRFAHKSFLEFLCSQFTAFNTLSLQLFALADRKDRSFLRYPDLIIVEAIQRTFSIPSNKRLDNKEVDAFCSELIFRRVLAVKDGRIVLSELGTIAHVEIFARIMLWFVKTCPARLLEVMIRENIVPAVAWWAKAVALAASTESRAPVSRN